MLSRAVRLLTIRGIEVRLDPTLLVLAVLIVWSFSGRFALEHGRPTALVMAVAGMLLFLCSILAHELAHALEAIHRGVEVDSVTLLIFGGVTQMHAHSARPRDEFAIAGVGPFVSLLCGAVFGLVATAASLLPGVAAAPIAELAGLLALLNVLLALFNLVPGAPLDGGRVLRALLWWLLGDRSRAIRGAARSGQVLGLGLVGFGLYLVTRNPQTFIGALWYAVIGVFLIWAAGTEYRHSRLDDLYSTTSVRVLLQMIALTPPRVTAPTAGGSSAEIDDQVQIPSVELDADLHVLVDAFQGAHDRVRLLDAGLAHGEVTEQQVARAIGLLRRGRQPAAT